MQGTERMKQLTEAVAANRQRLSLIKSLGDTELDWMGYDTTADVVEFIEWAANQKDDREDVQGWVRKFGSKNSLLEHIKQAGSKNSLLEHIKRLA